MGTRGRETQDMGNTGLTLLPPPPSNGEALWRPQGTRRQNRTGGLQGGARSGTHGGAGSSGSHGGSRDSGGHGGSGSSGGHGGAGDSRGHGGSGESRGHGGSGDSVALVLDPATQAMTIWPPHKILPP